MSEEDGSKLTANRYRRTMLFHSHMKGIHSGTPVAKDGEQTTFKVICHGSQDYHHSCYRTHHMPATNTGTTNPRPRPSQPYRGTSKESYEAPDVKAGDIAIHQAS